VPPLIAKSSQSSRNAFERPGCAPCPISQTARDYFTASGTVEVEEGKATPLTLKLKHDGEIATTVRDAKTGVPVEKACLLAIDVSLGGFNGEGGWCSDAAGDPRGAAHLQALWVRPGDKAHGAQWVAPDGDTGDQRAGTP
jgi:hypothetical protein